ncbi:MAG TPA: hypothetical protein VEH27_00470 [Methylomirabilota bacterium]|nr:hypothetical protein [Methylomirabilota bacterium]
MCNQTVCLIAAELERQGITTVVIQFLRFVTDIIKPPRALMVPYPHGFPLGRPNDPELQHSIIEAALELAGDTSAAGPVIRDFVPPGGV